MHRMILRRLLTSIVTILVTTVLVFCFRFLLPGGPVQNMLGGTGEATSAQQVEILTERLGLDRPVIVQYFIWLKGVVQGDLGRSYYSSEQVTTVLRDRLVPSLELIIGALLVATIVGGVLGVYSAIRRQRLGGRAVLGYTGLAIAVPDFWLAAIAAGVFGLALGVFPAVGYTPLAEGLWANIHSVTLPILVLSITSGGFLARHLHSSMASVLSSPYTRTGWAVGLPPRTMYLNWALRNALGPTITFLPLAFAALVSGTVLVENVFNIPGLGTVIVDSVSQQDYPVVQGIVLLIGVLVAVLNLLADLMLAAIDPRVRRGG